MPDARLHALIPPRLRRTPFTHWRSNVSRAQDTPRTSKARDVVELP